MYSIRVSVDTLSALGMKKTVQTSGWAVVQMHVQADEHARRRPSSFMATLLPLSCLFRVTPLPLICHFMLV